jgi:hypothetical protein
MARHLHRPRDAGRGGVTEEGARSDGFFDDELYYIACAEHLGLGYIDHPPLSIWLLSGWQAVFGDSLAHVNLAVYGYYSMNGVDISVWEVAV